MVGGTENQLYGPAYDVNFKYLSYRMAVIYNKINEWVGPEQDKHLVYFQMYQAIRLATKSPHSIFVKHISEDVAA